MPAYTFEALTADGETRKGVMQADSARAARGLLRAQALVPVVVDVVSAGGQAQPGIIQPGLLNKSFFAKRAFNTTGLAIWTRQIAGLVASGLPLERALSSLSDEAQDEAQRNLVATLRAEVNGGSTFAKALSQHPREFSPIFTAVIGAGEQSRSEEHTSNSSHLDLSRMPSSA